MFIPVALYAWSAGTEGTTVDGVIVTDSILGVIIQVAHQAMHTAVQSPYSHDHKKLGEM